MDTIEIDTIDTQKLIDQVQFNCDISDANHAGDYTLCIYLLKMREYYRWIQALDFNDKLDNDGMSNWLREKEDTWDQVVDEPFRNIEISGASYEPFDSAGINSKIRGQSLFYHGGIGHKAAHHFFIADLLEARHQDSLPVFITGKEHARDLTSPPALSNSEEIIVRQESLKRMCWERYQEWNWNRNPSPMGKALSYYPFDDSIDEALQMMVNAEQNTLVLHELGELAISGDYEDKWSAMMLQILGTKAELLARAVRDHLADCLSTLPFLIEQGDPASLHFYFANLTYIRKELFPSAMQAYREWCDHGKTSALSDIAQKGALHWDKTIQSMLAIARHKAQNPAPAMIELIEKARF